MTECNINLLNIPILPLIPQMPFWEHLNANFVVDYSTVTKGENINVLVSEVKEHLEQNYSFHLKIFTDGSVLDSLDSGSGFVIPTLKIEKSYYIGKGFLIFTCELYAILMALQYIVESYLDIFNILICV